MKTGASTKELEIFEFLFLLKSNRFFRSFYSPLISKKRNGRTCVKASRQKR
jgi:hypothetical protein